MGKLFLTCMLLTSCVTVKETDLHNNLLKMYFLGCVESLQDYSIDNSKNVCILKREKIREEMDW